MRSQPVLIYSIVAGFIFFFIGLFTIYDYGINWDEPSHYLRGQAYLRFYLTGKKDYKDLPKIKDHYPINDYSSFPEDALRLNDSPYRRSMYQYDSEGEKFTYPYYIKSDSGHPPLNGILASFSNFIFYQKLGVLGDIESYHLFIIFLSAVLVGSIFYFTAVNYGLFSGVIASMALTTYPIFFAESHFNIKDPVLSSFYSLTIILFYFGITKANWKLILLSSIFAGTALGTKMNIIFVVFPLGLWFVLKYFNNIKRFKWFFTKKITLALVSFPFISLTIVYISWPYLWYDTISHTTNILEYYKKIGTTDHFDSLLFGFLNTYPTQWIIFTTPPVSLVLCFLGVLYSLKKGIKEEDKTSLLVLLWFAIPIIRVSLPQANIYGGIRQIMEYIPALSILSGVGAKYLLDLISSVAKSFRVPLVWYDRNAFKINFISSLIILLLFFPTILKLVQIHPNQNVYFKFFIGGLKGAYERNFPDWGATLGSVYKQGVDWLNENAEPSAKMTLVRGLLSNVPRITIREDIKFTHMYYSGEKKEGEYIMEVYNYQWRYDIPEKKRDYLNTLKPVYELRVEGVPLLFIWKNDEAHTLKSSS